MASWKESAKEIKELLKNRNSTKAQEQLAKSLEKFPNQLNLLSIATNVFRASNDHEKSLEFAELLIAHHPNNWNGYGRAAQDLLALKRFNESQEKIKAGLKQLPNQLNLLIIASSIYRRIGDREQSLQYANLLITHHPNEWQGYISATKDFIIKSFGEAQKTIY